MIDVVLKSLPIDGDVGGKAKYRLHATVFHTTTGAYVGGQPAGVGVSGFIFGSGVSDKNYVGVFYNNSQIDSNVGANTVDSSTVLATCLPTIVWNCPCKVKLYKGTRHNVADIRAPFSSGVSWAMGDHMYIDATHGGQWTNVSGASKGTSHGRVIVAPASVNDTMEAIFVDTVRTIRSY